MDNSSKVILHLCASEYGSDTRDYKAAGYDVRCITKEIGVENYHPPENVYGIFANPPCAMFSIARTVRAKKPRDLREGMGTVYECLRIIWEAQYKLEGNSLTPSLKFWALENPATGMLRHFLGKPAFAYSPNEFGDNYSKKTALWGKFNEPEKLPLMDNPAPKNRIPQVDLRIVRRNRSQRLELPATQPDSNRNQNQPKDKKSWQK